MTDVPPIKPTQPASEPAGVSEAPSNPVRIFVTPLVLFFTWLVTVLVFTLRRQPGIVCLTPVAWLLATVIGRSVVEFARKQGNRDLRKKAALAGGVFGALMGLLFAVDIAVVGAADPQTLSFAAWSGVLCMISGAGVCALIALGMVILSQARRGPGKENSK